MSDPATILRTAISDARVLLRDLANDAALPECFSAITKAIVTAFREGNKVLICGNGGSMCDAMHFAEELTGRFRNDRPPLPAIALCDPSHITCTANDYGFDQIFSRAVQALGRHGDVLIVLSTSGDSPNLLRAVQAAKTEDLTIVALLGKTGGKLADSKLCQHQAIFPGATSDRIQELHMLLLHSLVQAIEAQMFPH